MFYRYTRCRLQMIIGPRPYSVYSGCRSSCQNLWKFPSRLTADQSAAAAIS